MRAPRRDPVDPADPTPKIAELIDLDTMVGLEIGALFSPRLPPEHPNLRFLDHVSTEDLRAKYKDDPGAGPRLDDFVEVDYVALPGLRLREVVGDDGPFDFVIASHVIEHVPDPIGWLQQISEILRDGGVLSLVIPDRRFTFDVNRPTTTTAELIDAYLRERSVPSYQQVYGHEAGFVGGPSEDRIALWRGLDLRGVRRNDVPDPDVFAYDRCVGHQADGGYVDVHCSVFTPDSFLDLYTDLVELGLIDLELATFHTTAVGHIEFFASLRKVAEPSMAAGARAIATAEAYRGQLPAGDPLPPLEEPAPASVADDGVARPVELSNVEATAVLGKRAVLTKARAIAHRIRPGEPGPAAPDRANGADPAPPVRQPQDGTSKLRELIDLDSMRGLELGALMHPRLDPSHPNMYFLDHASTEDLKAKYADDPHAGPRRDQFVDVDYVWQPGLRLAEVVGDDGPFDFLIASHVIEHIADPIGWLEQLGEVLRDGGFLALFIPDRRWTFDLARRDTTVAELIDAHLEQRQMPGLQQIYEHASQYRSDADALSLWLGADLLANPRPDGDSRAFALQVCRDQVRTGEYVDVHCSVFTPDSFLERYQVLVRLGLVDFEIERFDTTDWGGVDFFVVLRKVVDPTAADRARMIEVAASYVGQPYAGGPEPTSDPAAGGPDDGGPGPDLVLGVSGQEARLIEAKRRAMASLRRSLGRG